MALSAGAVSALVARLGKKLHYFVTNQASANGTVAGNDVVVTYDASDNYEPKYSTIDQIILNDASAVFTNIDAGASGTAGSVDVFPTTASKGKFTLAAVDNDGNTTTTLSNAAMAQASVISIPDPGAATANVLLTDAANDQSLVTSTAVELNKLDDSVTIFTKGAGVSAMESYACGYLRNGTLITSEFVIDLTGLVGSATDLDIIGNTGGATSAHLGQITTAKCGTLIGGKVECLEVPAGGTNDIDFYSAAESTGAQDGLVTSLDEVALVTSGGAWTSGAAKGMTLLPRANDYLYVTNGAASGGTFSAGKFRITLFGLGA